MNDPVLDTARAWAQRGVPFALATVVGVRGSTYRGLAARQLMGADGTSVGTVSGGCLDTDLREVAGRVVETGVAERVEFDLTADDEAIWGWGIGCNGATDLLVEPADSVAALLDLVSSSASETFCIVHPVTAASERRIVHTWTTPEDEVDEAALEALAVGRHRTETVGGTRYLFEVMGSPPRLVVFGAGHDAVPVITQAATLGFAPVVVDDRRQFLTAERFGDAPELIHSEPGALASAILPDAKTAVVLMSHNYLRDLDALRSLLGSEVAYIGALGPGDRLQRMLDDLREEGAQVADEDLAKMYGPAGLDIGAEGPTEIAWSVLAEVLAVMRGKGGGSLRDRKGPAAVRSV